MHWTGHTIQIPYFASSCQPSRRSFAYLLVQLVLCNGNGSTESPQINIQHVQWSKSDAGLLCMHANTQLHTLFKKHDSYWVFIIIFECTSLIILIPIFPAYCVRACYTITVADQGLRASCQGAVQLKHTLYLKITIFVYLDLLHSIQQNPLHTMKYGN